MNFDFKYAVRCFFILFMMIGFGRSVESLPRATDYPVALFGLDGASALLPVVSLGAASRTGKWAKKIACFVADTPVVICDPDNDEWISTQPIETIQEGDYVLSKDELSGHTSCEQVSSPIIIPDQEIFRVRLRNAEGESSEIDATGNHPFFANGQWTRVDELSPSDVVQSRGDDLEVVEVVRTQRFETVYNFTVSNHHTYFVGENAAWVHNIKICRFDGPKPKYHINKAHVPGQGLQRGKTPLPKDAEEVFKNAVPGDPVNPLAPWFGKNADGQVYRFSRANDGTAHFSGIDGVGDGIRNLKPYAKSRLEGIK